MLVNVENLSPIKKKISFEIPSERVSKEIEKVYEEIKKTVTIKGFRKGKVPRAIIEKHYSERMHADALKNLINDTYFKALIDKKILPVSQPEFESDPLKPGESFQYAAVFETAPEIELKEYLGIKVEKRKLVADEKVVDARIVELQEGMGQLKAVEDARPAKDGDFVSIDFKGFLDGVPFERGEAQDYQLQLGSNTFIPGFEAQVVGMSPGDARDVKVTFPADYGNAELAGKDVTFDVKLKEIKAKELPPLDDEFAKQLGSFESIGELRARISEVFEKEEVQKIENEVRDNLVKALIEKHEFEVPEAMVEKQLNVLIENMKSNLAGQNMSFEQLGTSEEKIREQSRSVAVNQVKGSLLLAAIAEKEEIAVEDAEIEEKIRDIAARANKDFEIVFGIYQSNPYAKDTLIMQMREDKVIDFLLSQATVSEVEKQSE
ncbi:MAG: trigger factor [Geobacter sp.]|nr:MAG: trigger factor [Geobacter sp.]